MKYKIYIMFFSLLTNTIEGSIKSIRISKIQLIFNQSKKIRMRYQQVLLKKTCVEKRVEFRN